MEEIDVTRADDELVAETPDTGINRPKNSLLAKIKLYPNAICLAAIVLCVVTSLVAAGYIAKSSPYALAMPAVIMFALVFLIDDCRRIKAAAFWVAGILLLLYLAATSYLLLDMYAGYQALSEYFAGDAFSSSPATLVWIIVMQTIFALGGVVMILKCSGRPTSGSQTTRKFRIPSIVLVVGTVALSVLLVLALLNDNVGAAIGYLARRLEILWAIWGF